jgi:hypothetical protein
MKNTGKNALPSVRGNILAVSANIAIVSVIYLFVGATVSYVLKNTFPRHSADWESWPRWKQILDISVEMMVIVIISFWLTYFARYIIPIIHVRHSLEHLIESTGVQIAFLYAVFVFLEVLDDKLIWVYKDIFG